jgi:hypothetical protein
MSQKLNSAIAAIGIDIGKNSSHVVGHDHDQRGAIAPGLPARSLASRITLDPPAQSRCLQSARSPHVPLPAVLFLSTSFGRAAHFFPSSVSLFDLKARFFVPTRALLTSARAGAVKVGRRTNFAACSAVAWPHLDSSEHDGTLGAIGMTIRGEPACGRDQSRHNLVSGGSKDPNHDAVMRIGSEAPKRRTHSPFRH